MRTKTVYLLHFSRPLHHAQHYLGSAVDVEARYMEHIHGGGSPLVKAVVAAGIEVVVAMTWSTKNETGRQLERGLKNQKNSPRLCPICKEINGTKSRHRPEGDLDDRRQQASSRVRVSREWSSERPRARRSE